MVYYIDYYIDYYIGSYIPIRVYRPLPASGRRGRLILNSMASFCRCLFAKVDFPRHNGSGLRVGDLRMEMQDRAVGKRIVNGIPTNHREVEE